MEVIKENIQRCQLFYNSDFYKSLSEIHPEYIDSIFTKLCEDPDAGDVSLYQLLGDKFQKPYRKSYLIDEVDGVKIKLAADIICGRKQIVKFHQSNFKKWIQDYECVRTNLNLHFLWPKHPVPTVNTLRYRIYLDRIDCLLYDLKQYFLGRLTPMGPAYQQELTALWLSQFNDFKEFIDTMQLNCFVNEDYNVLDIAMGRQSFIEHIYTLKEVKNSWEDYMSNMLRLNQEGTFA